jgi:glycosyltransferase involved in cell wall biosynthesis
LHTARRIAYLDPGSVSILHIWNRLPRTVDAARRRHPGVVVLRDVSIAREHDFELGDHISIENEAVDLFVSPSAYASEQLIAWGIPREKLVEVPFGVDTERFRPRSGAAARPGADGPVRFAFAGAVSGRKGIPSLLRVWKRLSLDHAELHLYGTVKPEVQPWLDGVPRVYTHGFLDLTEELPKNDVFAFPSTREGSSKAVYEALASGLAVITTSNAGSVVRDGEEGILVPPEDEAALEEAIVYLYENAEARQRMGAMARARAEAFTWERYARRVWQIYEASKELCSRT